jgi:hypothetical protein
MRHPIAGPAIAATCLLLGASLVPVATAAAGKSHPAHKPAGKVSVTPLPAHLPKVHVTVPRYRGPASAAYTKAARLFTQPFLVPGPAEADWRIVNIVVARLFDGTFVIDSRGKAVQTGAISPEYHSQSPADAFTVTVTYKAPPEYVTLMETRLHETLKGARGVRVAGLKAQMADGRDGKIPIVTLVARMDNLSLVLTARRQSGTVALLESALKDLRAAIA